MTLTAAERQFLHIAKAAVSGGELPAESVDWPAVFALAGQQKLLPILFETVRKMPVAKENAALFAVTSSKSSGRCCTRPCGHRSLQTSTKSSARQGCTPSWSRVSFAAASIRCEITASARTTIF